MKLTTKIKNRSEHILHWIALWNGGINLTEKEKEFFGELLYRYMDMVDKGVKEPYISKLLFSTEVQKEIKEKLKLSKQGMTNYRQALKNKGVIRYVNEWGTHSIPQVLIPKEEVTFKWEYDES